MRGRRPLLLPLVPVYSAGLWFQEQFRAKGARRLKQPVVSVGSLSAGGAGKTPVVAALAELLVRRGYGVDVLSRGYGRASETVELVDPAGNAGRYGDEPLLLSRRLGVPVYVGADRYAAGVLAEAEGGRRIHLLDDGFQHRRLGRALDIVLLTAEDAADCLLPAGNLREPLARLRGAAVVVVREEEAEGLRPVVARFGGGAMPVWVIRRRLNVEGAEGRLRAMAFCGIARPEGFFAMLRAGGSGLAGTVIFRDHHSYGASDVERLIAEARRVRAGGFVTTEKDAVKLSQAMRGRLEAVGPLIVAALAVEFQNEDEVLREVVAAAWPPASSFLA